MTDKALHSDQQRFLLNLARDAIRHYLKTGKQLRAKTEDGLLNEKRGAFVTLKIEEKLRGCIGYPAPYDPLYITIIDAAVAAASKDYRFQPITEAELPRTEIEISVLTPPEPIKDVSRIEIGKHGIIVSQGFSKGLLLPQVPVEWGWDLETYLKHGCLKAGLDEDAWKKGAEVQIFTAQVFSD